MGGVAANQALSVEVVERLWSLGVRTWCVCPGGRNAPLVEALEQVRGRGIAVFEFFEERSAAFFALGRARRDRRPVAVVTTSGTAAAELLPAMVEAYYSGTPLLALTADRPRAFRGTGAPQSIEQANLFGVHARQSLDIDAPGDWHVDSCCWPVHLNVCFAEPLVAGWRPEVAPALDVSADEPFLTRTTPVSNGAGLAAQAEKVRRPLVLLGALQDAGDRDAVLGLCRRLGAPVLAEASSHLKPLLGGLLLRSGEEAARQGMARGVFDAVLRVGDVPSFRLWRDLEQARELPVLSISRRPWRGLTHGLHVEVESGAPLPLATLRMDVGFDERALEDLRALDDRLSAATDALVAKYPASEPALVRRLSETIAPGSFVYLGNSLPIREWNQFASIAERHLEFGENRGANGIDGQLSSFLGAARPGPGNWAMVGDLTALYDLPSLWALRHVEGPVRIVVINNGGGRIFERLFRNPRFQNRHALGFEAWARLWDVAFVTEPAACPAGGPAIVEMRPDEAATEAFWRDLHASQGG